MRYTSTHTDPRTLSVLDLAQMKAQGEKITCLTAYDASFSRLLDQAGVDVILVGDSLGMVIQGQSSTIPVTLDEMIYHSRCVAGAKKRAFLITDLPFMSYSDPHVAALNAARLMREGRAEMVKLEGGQPHLEAVRHLTAQGIPVCGHLGLLPQSVHQLGGYRVQGKTELDAKLLLEDALSLQAAGAKLLVLECVPSGLAKKVSEQLDIPTIGIGAGVDCDGQVLVLYDMLNISHGKRPRFSRNFMTDGNTIEAAIAAYVAAVKTRQFPAKEHGFK